MKLNGLYTCVNVWCWITRRSTFIPPTSATPHCTNILANKRYLIKIVELVYQSLQNKVHSFIHSIVHGLSALCNFCRTFWWPRFCDFVFSLCLLLTFSWPDPRLESTQCKMHVLTIQARIPICFEQLMAYIGIVWIVGRKENMVTMLFTSGSFLLVMSNCFLRKDHGHYLKIPSWNVSHIVIILILWIKDFNLCLIQSFTYKMKTKTIFYILFLAV